ncbi:MAG: DUF3830 family protein [Desulfobacterales bacterium]|nr:MAG: DUF3830 family protein [Desulfobacterales bacterium]
MSKSAALQVGPYQATIELFEDRAPRTVAKIWQLLPLDVPLSHAKFAGDELMFMIPLVLEPEWFKQTIETADVLYYPIQQTVCLFFGSKIVPFGAGPFNAIGRISAGLADLTTVAELIRQEGFQKARLVPRPAK